MLGRIAHGSMPFLGVSAIEQMSEVIEAIRTELGPVLADRVTAMPVVPAPARHATININAITGGQAGQTIQTPCVADRCSAVFDRRFLIEEGFDATRAEIVSLLERAAARSPSLRYTLTDLLNVQPVQDPEDAPLVQTLQAAIRDVLGREATLVASPGTSDHKHVARIAGVEQCVAYGPGVLEMAHQPDEWCGVSDLIAAAKVLALTMVRLAG